MAAGDPTGDDLCVGTTNGNTLTTSFAEREIVFSAPYALVSGTKYAIIIRAPEINDEDNDVMVNMKYAGAYSNGDEYYSTNSGTSWTKVSDYDFWFKTKEDSTEKDTYTFTDDTFAEAVYDTRWGAQTFTASSSYNISSVILRLRKFFNFNNVGTITVSIRATEAAGPQKVTTPSPIDTFSGMTLDWQAFGWTADGAAPEEEVYNVYFGTNPSALSLIALESPLTSVAQSYLQTVVGVGLYSTTYYWRVDTYWPSTAQTATGDVWSLSTIVFATPASGARGGAGGGSGGVADDKQLNIKTRLVAFARNKVFYEDL